MVVKGDFCIKKNGVFWENISGVRPFLIDTVKYEFRGFIFLETRESSTCR